MSITTVGGSQSFSYTGGGGSGYIGGTPAITWKGTTYSPTSTTDGGTSGNGSAKITFITKTFPTIYYNTTLLTEMKFNGTEIETVIYNGTELE